MKVFLTHMPFCLSEQHCFMNEGGVKIIVVPGPCEFICAGQKREEEKTLLFEWLGYELGATWPK